MPGTGSDFRLIDEMNLAVSRIRSAGGHGLGGTLSVMSHLHDDRREIDFDNLRPIDFDVLLSLDRTEVMESVLRSFRGEVTYVSESSTVHNVGTVSGWVTQRADSGRLGLDGDELSQDSSVLAYAAEDIMCSARLGIVESVLMINRVTLIQHWRGHRLLGAIVSNILDLLQLYPTTTIAVTQPEPLSLTTGRLLDPGPVRDAGMAKLHRACLASGFTRWKDTDVWWRTFDNGDVEIPYADF